MSVFMAFGIGFILYATICRISYVNFSNYPLAPYIVAGLAGLLGNIAWMYIAQTSSSHKEILVKGLAWDVMITSIYLFLPLIVFDIQGLSMYNKFGIGLVFLGVTMVKM